MTRAVEVGFQKPRFLGVVNLKILQSLSFSFFKVFFHKLSNLFNDNDIQIWIAICDVHMAENRSLDLSLLFIVFVGRNFVSDIWK